MLNKKGQGLSMTYIVIAALALVVLIVIVLFFTGGLEKLFGKQVKIVEEITEQELEIWRGQCRLYCSLGQVESWEKHVFNDKNRNGELEESKGEYNCKKLLPNWDLQNCKAEKETSPLKKQKFREQ